jgi:hypothetical protein
MPRARRWRRHRASCARARSKLGRFFPAMLDPFPRTAGEGAGRGKLDGPGQDKSRQSARPDPDGLTINDCRPATDRMGSRPARPGTRMHWNRSSAGRFGLVVNGSGLTLNETGLTMHWRGPAMNDLRSRGWTTFPWRWTGSVWRWPENVRRSTNAGWRRAGSVQAVARFRPAMHRHRMTVTKIRSTMHRHRLAVSDLRPTMHRHRLAVTETRSTMDRNGLTAAAICPRAGRPSQWLLPFPPLRTAAVPAHRA